MTNFTVTREQYLKRRIYLKRQHIFIIREDIRELEKKLKSLSEKEKQEEVLI
ncbi:MAG: hypothetical protein R6T98_08265 [Desulfatiglandales bacterium]